MDVALTSGGADDEQAVRNLFVAYFYEMSAWDPGIVLNELGLPVWHELQASVPRTLDECSSHNWWIRESCVRYAIRVDGVPSGFAFVCERPAHIEEKVDNELLDFYVAPKARGKGVGAAAAHEVLRRHRGSWLLFTLRENLGAQVFWRAVLADAQDVAESSDATEFRFRT